jgi:hypothetical protein
MLEERESFQALVVEEGEDREELGAEGGCEGWGEDNGGENCGCGEGFEAELPILFRLELNLV